MSKNVIDNNYYEVEYYAYNGEHGHLGSYPTYSSALKEAKDLYKREEKNDEGSLKEMSYIGISGDGDEFGIVYITNDYIKTTEEKHFKSKESYDNWIAVAQEVLKTGKPVKGSYKSETIKAYGGLINNLTKEEKDEYNQLLNKSNSKEFFYGTEHERLRELLAKISPYEAALMRFEVRKNEDCENYVKSISWAKHNGYYLSNDVSYNGYIFFEKLICNGEHKLQLQVYDGIIKKSEPVFSLYNREADFGQSITSETTYRFKQEHDESDFNSKNLHELFELALRKESELEKTCNKKMVKGGTAMGKRNLKKGDTIQIIARRWFERTNGNTYHSVDVHVNNEFVGREDFEYGYGDGYKQTAKKILQEKYKFPKGFDEKGALWHLREHGITILDNVTDVSRKKDLAKGGSIGSDFESFYANHGAIMTCGSYFNTEKKGVGGILAAGAVGIGIGAWLRGFLSKVGVPKRLMTTEKVSKEGNWEAVNWYEYDSKVQAFSEITKNDFNLLRCRYDYKQDYNGENGAVKNINENEREFYFVL